MDDLARARAEMHERYFGCTDCRSPICRYPRYLLLCVSTVTMGVATRMECSKDTVRSVFWPMTKMKLIIFSKEMK